MTEKQVKKPGKKVKDVTPSPRNASVKDYSVIVSPVITEKGAANEGSNTVVFRVDPRATKTDIRGAVERVFSVTVRSVRTATFAGKEKRTARSIGRRAGYKKAYVSLAEGSKIDLVEGV
jgi:large subunit ribosomal protein L23